MDRSRLNFLLNNKNKKIHTFKIKFNYLNTLKFNNITSLDYNFKNLKKKNSKYKKLKQTNLKPINKIKFLFKSSCLNVYYF